jgi:DNA-binding NarL/FixJ family response regulator
LERLRVLVSEDHEPVRGILVELLRADFEVVGAIGDGQKLVEAAVLLQPDVIVSDILMPIKNGFSARLEILARGIKAPFVFITLLDAGMISPFPDNLSYVHKSDLMAELTQSVRAVAAGRVYLSRLFRDLWGSRE